MAALKLAVVLRRGSRAARQHGRVEAREETAVQGWQLNVDLRLVSFVVDILRRRQRGRAASASEMRRVRSQDEQGEARPRR
jgi:hypothetical protein